MESAFGQSFEGVHVHTDDRASKSAESVGANAYTVGSDVVFKSGQYDPASSVGQRTIAHELSHVVQQSRGPVDGSDAPGGIRVSDPSDRFERAADATADQVMSAVSSAQPSASDAGAAVQREEVEAASVAAVQREAAPEEEEEVPGTLGTLPFQIIGVVLLIASVVFFVLELKHPGMGLPAIMGVTVWSSAGCTCSTPRCRRRASRRS